MAGFKKFISFLVLTWLFTLHTNVLGKISNELFDFIKENYKTVGGVHLYFCKIKDAEACFRSLGKFGRLYNVRWLRKVDEPTELYISPYQPQRIGVFLDLSCQEGYQLLNKTKTFFNASYSWTFWTEEEELDFLNQTRMSIDSDVKLIRSGLKIYDVYRLHESTPFVQELLQVWSGSTGVQDVRRPSQRTDFNGLILNASVTMLDMKISTSNLPFFLDRFYEAGKDNARRASLSLCVNLEEMYNFSYRYIIAETWGYPQPDGSVAGMIGQMKRGESEVGLIPAKFENWRWNHIDYITSLKEVNFCFTFLQPTLIGTPKALILPFSPTLWSCLAALGLVLVLALRLLGRYETASGSDTWSGSLLLVIGTISQQGIPYTAEKSPTRIVHGFLLIVSFITVVYYNTFILNGLLLQAPNAIQNFEQVLKSNLHIALLDMSYLRYEMTKNDSLTLRTMEKVDKSDPSKVFVNVSEGVALIKTGRFAYFTEDQSVYPGAARILTDAEICGLTEVNKENPFSLGPMARKNWPYKEHFRRGFTRMRDRGVFKREVDNWFLKKPECQWRQDALSLGTEPLTLAYCLYLAGAGISIICLLAEIYIHRLSRRRSGELPLFSSRIKQKK